MIAVIQGFVFGLIMYAVIAGILYVWKGPASVKTLWFLILGCLLLGMKSALLNADKSTARVLLRATSAQSNGSAAMTVPGADWRDKSFSPLSGPDYVINHVPKDVALRLIPHLGLPREKARELEGRLGG